MIISIAGKAGNGKTTTANMIKNLLGENWEIKSWGTKVKEIASILTGIPVEKFNDHEFKKTYLPEFGMTVRELLKKIGTDAIRDNVHYDAWVIALMKNYKPVTKLTIDHFPNWIIDDTRFPNEYNTTGLSGVIIRVHKTHPDAKLYENSSDLRAYYPYPSKENSLIDIFGNILPENGFDDHKSEFSLDDYHFDYELYASNTDELLIEVKKMLQYFKLNK